MSDATVREVDVVVVGMGVAGEAVAAQLASAGLEVVGVENQLVGGECAYWGCIPTKMMVRASDALTQARHLDGVAGTASVQADWKPLARQIREEGTDDWDDQVAVDRFTGQGGHFERGCAELIGPGRVRVNDQEYRARRGVVLATGTVPTVPPIPGLAETPYWTNREAVKAEAPPASLAVLGGGAVGLELAQVYARFGTRVTVIEAADRLLSTEEPEAARLIRHVFDDEGITVHTGAAVDRISHDDNGFELRLPDGAVRAEELLVATGRHVDLSGLGVDAVGLDTKAPSLSVDEQMRAGEGLWAVGDVTGHGAFTHVGTYQAAIAARDILGLRGPGADYRALPRVTFTDPEIGAVGLTEAQARERHARVRVGLVEGGASTRAWIHQASNHELIKLVGDTHEGVLVGATCVGPAGGEVLGALTVAIHGRVPIADLRHMMYAYPTFHRGIEAALDALHH